MEILTARRQRLADEPPGGTARALAHAEGLGAVVPGRAV